MRCSGADQDDGASELHACTSLLRLPQHDHFSQGNPLLLENDAYWEKFSCLAKKKSIWRSRQVPWSRSRVSHKGKTSSGWPHWWVRVWMKSSICRFLVTFITSTFNISSFCIALYLSISLLENLHVESGNSCFILICGKLLKLRRSHRILPSLLPDIWAVRGHL